MNTQRILTKAIGKSFDLELLAYLLDQRPNAFGFAVQDTGGANGNELSIVRETGTPTMEQMKGFLEDAKDFRAMVYLGQLDSKFNKDDIQPFILTDGDDQPFLTLGLEGDFSKFADPASGHTEEYNFATKIIIPSLLEICEFADGDLDIISKKVNGDLFNNILLSNIGHRGSLTILGLDGEPIWLGKNELGDTYDWGQTSNEHDYAGYLAQQAAAETKAAEIKAAATAPVVEKKSRFSFRGKPATPPALPQDVATVGEGPRASVPLVTQVGATTIKTVEPSEPRVIKVPPWVHSNDDIKAYYTLVLGHVPDKWKKRIPIMNPVIDKLPSNAGEFLQMRADAMKNSLANPTVTKAERIEAAKTETSAGAPKTGAEIAAIRKEENTPIIGARELEDILDIIANVDSQANTKIPTADIQAVEKKLGAFSTSVGSTWPAMLNWPVSTFFQIGNKPKGVAALVQIIAELRGLVRENIKVEDLVGGGEKVVTTVTKSGDSTVKTESVVIAAKEPEKKSFRFRGKAA